MARNFVRLALLTCVVSAPDHLTGGAMFEGHGVRRPVSYGVGTKIITEGAAETVPGAVPRVV